MKTLIIRPSGRGNNLRWNICFVRNEFSSIYRNATNTLFRTATSIYCAPEYRQAYGVMQPDPRCRASRPTNRDRTICCAVAEFHHRRRLIMGDAAALIEPGKE